MLLAGTGALGIACAEPATPRPVDAAPQTAAPEPPGALEPPPVEAAVPLTEPAPDADPGPAVAAPPELSSGAPKRIAARHILVHYSGSMGADPQLRRSRSEAVARARDLLSQVQAGADLGELALKQSDGPSAGRNGSLGSFGRGSMQEDFEKAAFALRVGEVSELVETPFGLHIIQRQQLIEARVAHVLVQWEGGPRASTTRSKEDARLIAQDARRRVLAGEPLASVAAELSDGGSGPRGGELGWFQQGHVQPAFEPVFGLEAGGVSEVIESVYGFHVLLRLE